MEEKEEVMRRRAEEKFFKTEEFKPREVYMLIERASTFVKINEKGEVFIELQKCTDLEKVQLVLSARFLGSKLRKEINPIVTSEEIARYTELDSRIARARLTDAVKLNFAERIDRGTYRVRSFAKIKSFIDELETKYMKRESDNK